MYRSVAVIGSFQKFYEDVCGLISVFRKNGFNVTSPYLSQITNSRYGFVIFEADDQTLSDDEIQTDTLRKILNADAVYVYDLPIEGKTPPDKGYIGRTTCYEIGILMAKNKPIYYLYPPDDLPVPITSEQILDPQTFITKFKAHETSFLLPKKEKLECNSALKAVFGRSSLLVCGSMKFFNAMQKTKNILEALGLDVIIPEDETFLPEQTPQEFNEFKRKVSQEYLKKIREQGTLAILVYNEEKTE